MPRRVIPEHQQVNEANCASVAQRDAPLLGTDRIHGVRGRLDSAREVGKSRHVASTHRRDSAGRAHGDFFHAASTFVSIALGGGLAERPARLHASSSLSSALYSSSALTHIRSPSALSPAAPRSHAAS
eukprot:3316840-Pleurochrysis_carterae.AAC.3